METLYHLSWRGYPAFALAALGVVLLVRGAWREYRAARRHRTGTDTRSLGMIRTFRRAILGLTLVGVAAGWQWHVPWLLAFTLAVGFEETFESSIHIAALAQAERLPRSHAAMPFRRDPKHDAGNTTEAHRGENGGRSTVEGARPVV